jgi:8-oxo-dGTP pyrophosphatase MutT (NUDIX family)
MIPPAIVTAIVERLTRELARPRRRYRPLWMGRNTVGWIDDLRALRLRAFADVFDVRDDAIVLAPGLDAAAAATTALDRVARVLAAEGQLTAWRDERYAVVPSFGAPPLFLLERAAARYFGVHTYAVHVNGLVSRDDEVAMWIARRSPAKAIDPGLLDNLVGGGIAAGHEIATTVVKEAWEEAGIAESLARQAHPVGTVDICREQPDGLQRETIFVHDLWLPAAFVPAGQDGEVVAHRLVSLYDAARLIAGTSGPDVVTADASLVVVDCLLRQGAIDPGAPGYAALAALGRAPGG